MNKQADANVKAAQQAAQGCCKRIPSLGSAEVRLAAEPSSQALDAFLAAHSAWLAQAPSSKQSAEATDEALAALSAAWAKAPLFQHLGLDPKAAQEARGSPALACSCRRPCRRSARQPAKTHWRPTPSVPF